MLPPQSYRIRQRRAGLAGALCAVVLVAGCGETSSKDQKRAPGATNANANGTIEQCTGDKERNASDPACSSTTKVTADPMLSAAEKALTARPGSSATVTLQAKPTEGVTVLTFGVDLFSNDGYSSVNGFPQQFTAVSYGNARFCVFVPPTILPGEYRAKFFATGTVKGTGTTFDATGQTIDIPFRVEGSAVNPNATPAATCPDTTDSSDPTAGPNTPTKKYSPAAP